MANWRGKSLWSVGSRFIAAGLSFLFNIILARTLSQDDLGQFFIGLSMAWGGALVCQWGSTILAVKWVAAARVRGDQDAVRSAVWSLVFFTLAQGVVASSLFFLAPRPLVIAATWAAWTFAVCLQSLIPELLRGFDDLKWASLFSGPVAQAFAVIVLGVGWLIKGHLLYYQAAALLIGAISLSCFVGLVLVARRAPITFKLRSYREFIHETTPIAMSLGFTYLLAQADLWACSFLLRHEDVAVYGIAQKFCAFVSMPLAVFGAVATPKMAEFLAERDFEKLKNVVGRGTWLVSLMAFGIFIAVAGVGLPIMRLAFGENYARSYPIFLILGAGQVIHAVAGPNGYILLLSGGQRAAMIATVTSACVLMGLAYFGANQLGVQGVAAASFFALAMQTAWMWREVRKRLSFSPHFQWSKRT